MKKAKKQNASGSVQVKNGVLYTVIAVTIGGQRKQHWETTGLHAKGNKRQATAVLRQRIADYNTRYPIETQIAHRPRPRGLDCDPLFSDYLEQWLTVSSHNVQELTTVSRSGMLRARIRPYFDSRKITLLGLRPVDIESFYEELYDDDLSGSTVLHYHQFMKQALKSAVRKDMLPSNPFDKIDRPKKNVFEGGYYTAEEVLEMLEIFENDPARVPVTLAAYYGFRRSEVLGLMWNSVDFVGHTISVQHKVIERPRSQGETIVISDQLKTVASRRTLPLIPVVEKLLLAHKAQIEENRRIWKKGYNKQYLDMVCVDPQGNLFKPGYLSEHFPLVLEKNGMRRIRFHDLRHTAASLLLKQHVDMKYIQHWLGHSNYSTTADIYAHLDSGASVETAQAMAEALRGKPGKKENSLSK